MANLNRIILVGRLAADPDSRSTVEGLPIARFKLVVERPFGGQGENGSDLIDIVAWRRLAEICGQYLKKNQLVLVDGRIQNRSFEDQSGQRKWVTEVVAANMTMLEKGQGGKREEAAVALATEDEVVDDADLASDLPF
ncbi:MAG: single-stranded DNA-binding protein [Candidatus Margulisbacteria bacterium]|nr:single-stranded DNA-binding protein [Candidatus Margulisiibacteriota bacterium]